VHVNGPVAQDQPGLPVVAVVKQSPADKAGLVDGDVLTRLGEVNLDKPEALTRAARQYAGKTVELDFRRSGNPGKAMITLNQRSQ
jgi:S1-C subfamily serine protease